MAKFGPVFDQIRTFKGSLMLESNHVALRVLASQISKFEDLSVIKICIWKMFDRYVSLMVIPIMEFQVRRYKIRKF